ncbi:MAG: BON domain-containing protein [Planctomycetota bacterium]
MPREENRPDEEQQRLREDAAAADDPAEWERRIRAGRPVAPDPEELYEGEADQPRDQHYVHISEAGYGSPEAGKPDLTHAEERRAAEARAGDSSARAADTPAPGYEQYAAPDFGELDTSANSAGPRLSEARGAAGEAANELGAAARARPDDPYARSDGQILKDIRQRLERDERVDAGQIYVLVQDGAVILRGAVPSVEARHAAEELAGAVFGITDLVNELTVEPTAPTLGAT